MRLFIRGDVGFAEEAGARNIAFFRVKWLQPAMKGTSCVRRLRLGWFRTRWVSPLCSATSGCSCVRSSMRVLKPMAADLSGMAGCLLSSDVVTCVEMCRFATLCCETRCNGCMNVAWGLCCGRSRSTKPCIFPCKVVAAGDERYLVCAAVVFVPVCVVLCVS